MSGSGSRASGSSAASGTSSSGSTASTQLPSESMVHSSQTTGTQHSPHPTSGTGYESDRSVSLARRHHKTGGHRTSTGTAKTPPNASHHVHRGPARSVSLAHPRSGAATSASHKRDTREEGGKKSDGHKAAAAPAPAVQHKQSGRAPATTAREPTKHGKKKAPRLSRKQMVTARESKLAKQQPAEQSPHATMQGRRSVGSHYAYEYSSGSDFHKKLEHWHKSDKAKGAMFDGAGSPTSSGAERRDAADGDGDGDSASGDSNDSGDGEGDEPDTHDMI